MATSRPVVSIYQFDNASEKTGTCPMPTALTMPLRPDLVRYIHTNVSKNKRQAYAVKDKVGYDTAAESWGTGRAVARVPRVPGGGTHRAGQGAFGNMCRGGGMFCPTKTWRRWHRRVNVTQKRHAVATALAATCVTPLVMARGHKIEKVRELPLVLASGPAEPKSKKVIEWLKAAGCGDELQKVSNSKKVRAGKGKMRNRRYVKSCGPLVIHEDGFDVKGFRNVPGVDTITVEKLSLLKLAPGGHFGRFCIWTKAAFAKLEELYTSKKGYSLHRAMMKNSDLNRIINSQEVQEELLPKMEAPVHTKGNKNPLKNTAILKKLNPAALEARSARKRARGQETVEKKKKARIAATKTHKKENKKGDETFYKNLMKAFESKAAKADDEEEEE